MLTTRKVAFVCSTTNFPYYKTLTTVHWPGYIPILENTTVPCPAILCRLKDHSRLPGPQKQHETHNRGQPVPKDKGDPYEHLYNPKTKP